jgi:hypothetical protein
MTSRPILLATASVFGLAGLALLFAPHEMLRLLGASGASGGMSVFAQLLGAAWVGLAYGNWTARGLAVGGIHGRAIVIGNLMHSTIGALVLAREAVDGGPVVLWPVTAILGATSLAFGWLMRNPPVAPPPGS